MDLTDWIPAVTTTSALAAIWLVRTLIANRLSNSVRHEYEAKLEQLRSSLHRAEDDLRRESEQRTLQLATVREGALAGLATRQMALDRRRIRAVEEIWDAVTGLAKAEQLAHILAVFNLKEVSRAVSTDPRLRQLFADLSSGVNVEELGTRYPSKARPFISEIAWARFSAYSIVVGMAVTRVHMLKGGVDAPNIFREDYIKTLLKAALPHQEKFIDEHASDRAYLLLEELRATLLAELRKELKGVESDRDTIDRAKAIIGAPEAADRSLQEQRMNVSIESDQR